MKHRLTFLVVPVITLVLVLTGCAGQQQSKATYPEKPIEFVVPFSPGGGSDVLARHIADIVQKEKLLPQPLQVVNKPGASGQVGGSYVATKKGDPYVIMTFTNGQLSTPKVVPGSVPPLSFTPVALVAMDEQCIIVKKESPYQTLDQLLEAARKAPKAVSIGGTSVAEEDRVVNTMLEKAAQITFNYVPFDSGGEVMKALLGGHIDCAWANPAECLSQVEAGMVRVLAVAAPQRLKKWPEVPTIKESGLDVVFQMFRGIVGPPEMPKDAVQVLGEAFKKLTESQDWQSRYIEQNALTAAYMNPEEFGAYLQEMDAQVTEVLKTLGMIQ